VNEKRYNRCLIGSV